MPGASIRKRKPSATEAAADMAAKLGLRLLQHDTDTDQKTIRQSQVDPASLDRSVGIRNEFCEGWSRDTDRPWSTSLSWCTFYISYIVHSPSHWKAIVKGEHRRAT